MTTLTAARRKNQRLQPYAGNPMADINVTPLIDVLLVLLMVFMLAAPILAHRIKLDIPQRGPPDPQKHEIIELRISSSGEVYYDGVQIPAVALEPQLRIAAAKSPQPQVHLDADLSASYDKFAATLATVKTAGIQNIGLAKIPER